MVAFGTSMAGMPQRALLPVQGSESWEASLLPESCVGHSLSALPASKLALEDTLNPGDRLLMVCYNDGDDMMWALQLKEDQHLSLPAPLTLCQFLCLPVFANCLPLNHHFDLFASLHLSLSAPFLNLLSPFLLAHLSISRWT